MPESNVVLWTGTVALITIMLGIIGVLLSNGFKGLKEQLKDLRDDLSNHRTLAESNSLRLTAMESRCEERHRNLARRPGHDE